MLIWIKFLIYKMFDSNPHTPLNAVKGANLNLIEINFDNSENSTRETNHSQDNLKSFEDTIEIKDEQKNAKKQGRKKNFFIKK